MKPKPLLQTQPPLPAQLVLFISAARSPDQTLFEVQRPLAAHRRQRSQHFLVVGPSNRSLDRSVSLGRRSPSWSFSRRNVFLENKKMERGNNFGKMRKTTENRKMRKNYCDLVRKEQSQSAFDFFPDLRNSFEIAFAAALARFGQFSCDFA